MKKNFSLLVSAAAFAIMACSDLGVSDPEAENYPTGWSAAQYMAVNSDLRALQIMDQVSILNTKSGLSSTEEDEAQFTDETFMESLAINYAGFTASTWDAEDATKLRHLKKYDIYGSISELVILDTLTLDTNAVGQQYIVYGKREGRPYRYCDVAEVSIKQGECQQDESGYYDSHLYCSYDGVNYCIDCDASEVCPELTLTPTETETEETETDTEETDTTTEVDTTEETSETDSTEVDTTEESATESVDSSEIETLEL